MKNKEEQRFLDWCKREYPEHKLTIVEREHDECGDILIVYLHECNRWLDTRIVAYNQSYPDERVIYSLTLDEVKQDE